VNRNGDQAGKHLWSKRFGNTSSQHTLATAVDGAGHVLLTGSLKGTVDFGNGPLTSAGDYDIFLLNLSP
jgi:hypothetical protein